VKSLPTFSYHQGVTKQETKKIGILKGWGTGDHLIMGYFDNFDNGFLNKY
jgi:hypothetical protein